MTGSGEAGSEFSVEIYLAAGMRQSHETTITYEASQTVLMKSKKQYTIHSTLDRVYGLKTPFELTMNIYATAEGVGGRVHLKSYDEREIEHLHNSILLSSARDSPISMYSGSQFFSVAKKCELGNVNSSPSQSYSRLDERAGRPGRPWATRSGIGGRMKL